MMAPRRRLPNRRRAETRDVIVGNKAFAVSVGYFDDGQPGEVFIIGQKWVYCVP